MDRFFTSLSKRQTMLLLTAVTFGGHDSVEALSFLPEEEGALLQHRAQELLQISRDKRIPVLVQEIKRLVKDRRGQLWSADPARLASLLQQERAALVEVVLRALPAPLAEAVRSHLPAREVTLSREVRPQILDIVRWKLEALLSRAAATRGGFKFSDVMLLQPRELLTVCERLGARVLGPAIAGLPAAEQEGLLAALPPGQRELTSRSVTANAPRKLEEAAARAQLALHGGAAELSRAIWSAGAQRLARACVAQSGEFAARLVERRRGEVGNLLMRWVKEEQQKPSQNRGDGGRTDIVADLERLASKGLIERPLRLLAPPKAPPSSAPLLEPPPPSLARRLPTPVPEEGAHPRDAMAERAARKAGARSSQGSEGGPSRERTDAHGQAPAQSDPRLSKPSAAPRRTGDVLVPPRSRERKGEQGEDRTPVPLAREEGRRTGELPAGSRSRESVGPLPPSSRAEGGRRTGEVPSTPRSREQARAYGEGRTPPVSRSRDPGKTPPPSAREGGRRTGSLPAAPRTSESLVAPPGLRRDARESEPLRRGERARPEGKAGRAAAEEGSLTPSDGKAGPRPIPPRHPVLSERPRRRTESGFAPPEPLPGRANERASSRLQPEGSRIFPSSAARGGRGSARSQAEPESPRAPRVLQGRSAPTAPAKKQEGTALQRFPRASSRSSKPPRKPGDGSDEGSR